MNGAMRGARTVARGVWSSLASGAARKFGGCFLLDMDDIATSSDEW